MIRALSAGVCAAVCLLVVPTAWGAAAGDKPFQPPEIRLPLMDKPPAIDGQVQPGEWTGADRMERFGRPAPLSPQQASFWVGADEKNLYIAVVSQTPPGGKLLARASKMPGDNDAPAALLDDTIELILDPHHSGADNRTIYHAIFNAKGAIWDQAYKLSGGGQAWRGHWIIGTKVSGDRWTIELAIPWSDMGVSRTDLNKPMGLRIGRNWQQSVGPKQTEWSPMGGPYTTPETMPVVVWDAAAPVVQTLQLQSGEGNQGLDIKVAVRNPSKKSMRVQAMVSNHPQNSAPAQTQETLTLAAGETRTVELKGAVQPTEPMASHILVTSADGKTIYYRRGFEWQLQAPRELWTLNASAASQIATSFAYYPYYNKMKVRVNASGLSDAGTIRTIHLALNAKGQDQTLAQTTMPALKEAQTQTVWTVPELAEGTYQLVVTFNPAGGGVGAAAGSATPPTTAGTIKPQVFDFVRHHFEWEHNKLGQSDVVIPPFTPIEVEGQTVDTILRKHTMSDCGLWAQVVADGQPLLKGPMRLEVSAGGKTWTAKGTDLKFTQHKPTSASAEAPWSAGPLKGSTLSRWDYDGMMTATLSLAPTDQKLDSVRLVIPLDDAQMPLMHACTDGLRFNYAGKTPEGQGQIWNGAKAARNAIIGSYVPYIWVGGAERGLSVFGENDAGWITDPKVPCQELVRTREGTLELILNLVAKPTKIDAERTILIGFQATPIKPMAPDWRAWTVNGAPPQNMPPQHLKQAFLGSCWYWGSLTAAADLYPRGQDFSLWEEFAKTRKTGQVDKDFIKKWLAGYKAPAGTSPPYPAHINAGFRTMSGRPTNVLVYTNGRGVRLDTPEGQTFIDPWERHAFTNRDREYGSATYYDLNPVESFRDYAEWYYKKMYDTFVDAIYWDDIFMQSTFDTVGTAAYQRPDGLIQPASGLFAMRDLIRRTAIFGHEAGKTNRNMVHMTNTAIAPILAFAASDLCWEDRSGADPFQKRFSRDYILAESIGRQFGNTPIALLLIRGGEKAQRDWAYRTAAGVLLAFEIKPWDSSAKDYWSNYQRLIDFGYGTKEVKVHNYWQKDYPLKVGGDETASILLSKPGAALAVVTDYGNGGDIHLQPDLSALGLSGSLVAKDVESGQTLQVGADGQITFPLKKDDFKVILIQGEGGR